MEEKELLSRAKTVALPRDAVAHKMTTRVPLALSTDQVSDARRIIEEDVSKFDSINYIYVVGKSGKLKGVLSIKEIFRTDPSTPISQVMRKKLVQAHPNTSQEKAARLAVKNNLKAIPIVDKDGALKGVLTSDQILSILDRESRDDLMRISGIILGKRQIETDEVSALHSYLYRIPWIIVGLFGGLMTAKVISGFENVLSENIILASFIPLVAYIANAVGAQTQTLYIRDLATKAKFSFVAYSLKQVGVSLLIGFSVWGVILLLSNFIWGSTILGLIVGLSLFIAILVATFFALVIPRVLDQFDTDPANGSGPFATIIQDLLSVLIYLSVASLFI
jgi:magnesium transporter